MLAERLAVRGEGERDDLGRRRPHGDQRVEPRGGRVRQELGVAEPLHPGEVIVNRVVDPVAPAEPDVERRDAQVIDEGRVVGARPEPVQLGREPAGGRVRGLAGPFGRGGVPERVERVERDVRRPRRAPLLDPELAERLAGADVGDRSGRVERQVAQRGDAVHVEFLAGDRRIDVEHQHGAFVELLGVLLGPLGRADEAVLLGVPTGVHQRPPRLPAVLDRRAQGPARLQGRGGAAPRIDRPVDPGVAVVAEDDPAVGLDLSLDRRDHVPDRLQLILDLDLEPDLDRARPDMVGERQAPLPARRDVRTGQGLQDRPRRVVTDRQGRDRREVIAPVQARGLRPDSFIVRFQRVVGQLAPCFYRVLEPAEREAGLLGKREPFGPFDRRGARRGRVARSEREELDAPALNRRAGAVGAVRIGVPLGVAVVGGVGIDQDSRCPSLLGIAHLEAAKQLAVACQDDLVLDVDPQPLQRREVLRPAVVGVHDLAFGPAADPVAVEGGEGVGAGRVLVARDRGFERRERLAGGPDQAQFRSAHRRVEQDLILGQVGLPAPLAELVADEQRGLVVGRSAGGVRLLGQRPKPGAGVDRGRDAERERLGLRLRGTRLGAETERRRRAWILPKSRDLRDRQGRDQGQARREPTSEHEVAPFENWLLDRAWVRGPNSERGWCCRSARIRRFGTRIQSQANPSSAPAARFDSSPRDRVPRSVSGTATGGAASNHCIDQFESCS